MYALQLLWPVNLAAFYPYPVSIGPWEWVVALAALIFYFWGVRSGWRTPAIEAAESAPAHHL